MDKNKRWSKDEEDYLKNNYHKLEILDICTKLNRSIGSVQAKSSKMKLIKRGKNFNYKYFDIIDTEEKAYWMGFIWCDGYLGIRNRENRQTEYNLKISLKKNDFKHLEKFNNNINGNYKVNFYKNNGFGKPDTECRLFITNRHMGSILVNKYGLIPHRSKCEKILSNIPTEYRKDFIRGILDADGSFTHYTTMDKNYNVNKYVVQIGTNEDILRWIEDVLIKEDLIPNYKRKLSKRHEDRDGEYKTLVLSGRLSFVNVLNWIYKDSKIYLDRKYEKYLSILGGDANVNE